MRTGVLLSVIAALGLAPALPADDTKAIDPEKGLKAVKDQLEKYRAGFGQVTQVKDDALGKTFPRHLFFTAHFRQYPIAREMPEPLRYANIFAFGADAKLTLINDAKTLEKFFKDNAAPVKDIDPGKAAARAWLKLSPELHQDGFYRFAIMDEATKAQLVKGAVSAGGKVVIMQGGNGEINARLSFTEDGKLAKVEEASKIMPGPRPICQATKLLDPDPIVRRMAEQDLLIMGRPARPYLEEQRTRATPELRQAIDRLWQRIVERDR